MKLGGNFGPGSNDTRRTVLDSLSFENRTVGFGLWSDAPEGNPIGIHIYNSVAFGNNVGFGCSDDVGVSTTTLRNDISYANTVGNYWPYPGPDWFTHDHNNWDIPITVTDADFAGVISAGMDGPRQADGSLPVLDFLRPAPSSSLIDAGVDIGLPYNPPYPDLGAFETE